MMVNGVTSRPFSARTLAPFKINEEAAGVSAVIDLSRKKYALPRTKVESDINRWSGVMPAEEEAEMQEEAAAAVKEGEAVLGKDGKTLMYAARCSICGTMTHVPFKPVPGRPIYCSDCLEKLKAGEMSPISSQEIRQKEKRQEQGVRELAELGIEFELKPQKDERPPRREIPHRSEPPRGRRESGAPRFARPRPKANEDGFVSLKDLVKKAMIKKEE
jgi:CxxC-x17-CxxC domain-containing protein